MLDVASGRRFRTSPLNVAAQRDFNRIDVDGQPPDAVERAFGSFEAEAIAAIRRVVETRGFPNDSDLNLLLNLICLLGVRNPRARSAFNGAREQVLRRVADILVSNEATWNSHLAKTRAVGDDLSKSVSFEDARRFVREANYNIEFHPQGNLRAELHAIDAVLPLLGQRVWSVLVAPDDGPEFICSDHPVALTWKGGRSGPIGYGLKETEVFFPLSRRVGFYGVYEDPINQVVVCKPGNVATMNRRVVWNAERHVYSAKSHFVMWHEGEIREIDC